MSLNGKGVVITGGARGIGGAMARAMLEADAHVHICDSDSAATAAFLDELPSASATVADAAVSQDVDRVMDDALSRLESFDILINNVGSFGPTKPIEDVTTAEWMECFDVSLHSAFYFVRRAVPVFKRQKSGVILNISSVAAQLGNPLRSPLAVAKAALEGFTTTLAMELGPDGVRVNTLVPGLVDSPAARRFIKVKADSQGITETQAAAQMTRNTSLRTMVEADDIAQAAVFLAGAAGKHISGQRLSICGNFETTRTP